MNFESLVGHINQVQDVLQAQAAHAVNLSLTARNWLVGYYIVEFEQHGEDRAKYGDNLLNRLAQSINKKGFSPRRLREYRQFYLVYPILGVEVRQYIENTSTKLLHSDASSIWRLPTAKLQSADNQEFGIWRSATAKLEEWATPPERLFYRINYASLSILSSIDNPLNHRTICHRGPLAESLREQIPPPTSVRRRYQAISAGEHLRREIQGIEGRRGK